jgi:hypothetical protein
MRFAGRTLIILLSSTAPIIACNDRAPQRADYARFGGRPAAPAAGAADSVGVALDAATMATTGGVVGNRPTRSLPLASPSPEVVEGTAASGQRLPSQTVAPGTMLVRVGQASLQVDSLETGIARIRDVARRTNAVIANTSMAGGRQQTRSASLELRVPSERFDEAVSSLSPIGKLESVNVTVEDVGEEFVDVEARVANARRLEERLVDLLAKRTGKLSDVLSVERELARVREQIERYEGRMRYLRTRASISTLTIALHEPFPIVAEHPGDRPMRDAFVQAWRNLVGVTAGIIASLGVIIPLGLVATVLILLGRRIPPFRDVRLTKPARPESA